MREQAWGKPWSTVGDDLSVQPHSARELSGGGRCPWEVLGWVRRAAGAGNRKAEALQGHRKRPGEKGGSWNEKQEIKGQ